MYIGIYINDSHLYAGMLNQDDEVVPISGTGLITDFKSSATELKIYIEDNFAYVGLPVNYLIANNYELNCYKYLLKGLQEPEKTIYTDPTGVLWNAPGLLALFLKKIKNDSTILNERDIEGAMVTTTAAISPELTKVLQLAFKMAGIPFYGVIGLDKSVWRGLGIADNSITERKRLVYNLDKRALTISLVSVDKKNYTDTLFIKTDDDLGARKLYDSVINFLAETYQEMTGKKIKKSAKNAVALRKMAEEILLDYFAQSKLYVRCVYKLTEPAIELVLTFAQLNVIVSKYMQQSIAFLKEAVSTIGITLDDIGEVVLTGESKLLQIVPLALRPIFVTGRTRIYHQSPTEIIPRGITLLANTEAERKISSSLTEEVTDKKPEGEKTNRTTSDKISKNEYIKQLLSIQSMQINKTGDI